MEIAVDGWRPGAADWDVVRNLPAEQLPALNDEQREVAKKLGIPEADYARRILAGEHSQEGLLAKVQRLASLLRRLISVSATDGRVRRITLRTIQERFDVEVEVGGQDMLLKIDEAIVDDYFEKGSKVAEEQLERIVDRAFAAKMQ